MIKIYKNLFFFIIKSFYFLIKKSNIFLINLSLKIFSINSFFFYKNIYSIADLKEKDINERISKSLLSKKLEKIYNFNNENSFLEIGCGYGVNLIEIKKKFPSSKIYGCDIHEACLKKLTYFNNDNFRLIDLLKIDSLKAYQTNSVDYVYMMHVLTHIMEKNIAHTLNVRKNIIENMLRIARKKIFLIDSKFCFSSQLNLDDMTFYQDHLSRNRIEYLNNLNNIIPNNTTVLIHPTEYKASVLEISKY